MEQLSSLNFQEITFAFLFVGTIYFLAKYGKQYLDQLLVDVKDERLRAEQERKEVSEKHAIERKEWVEISKRNIEVITTFTERFENVEDKVESIDEKVTAIVNSLRN